MSDRKININLAYLYLIISIFFRIFIIVFVYSLWQGRYWPDNGLLHEFELKFIIISLPFWLIPLSWCVIQRKNWDKIFFFVLLSFLPEIFIILCGPLYGLFMRKMELAINAVFFVSLPMFFLFELTFFVTLSNQKAMIKEISRET